MKNKAFLKSTWTISIGTAIFSLLLTIIYDYSKNKPVLSTILNILQEVLKFIVTILNFNLKVWWLMVGIVVIIGVFNFFTAYKQDSYKPDFTNYKEDILKSWKWSWNWHFNTTRQAWCVSDLTAHCPKCNTPLLDSSSYYGVMYECPRCNFRAEDSQCEQPHKIERIILDNINRNAERKKQSKTLL